MGWMPYTAEDGSQQLSPGYVAGNQRPTTDDTATPATPAGEPDDSTSSQTAQLGSEASATPTGETSHSSSDGSADGSPASPTDPSTAAPDGMEWLLVPKGSYQLGESGYLYPQTSGMHNDAPSADA